MSILVSKTVVFSKKKVFIFNRGNRVRFYFSPKVKEQAGSHHHSATMKK